MLQSQTTMYEILTLTVEYFGRHLKRDTMEQIEKRNSFQSFFFPFELVMERCINHFNTMTGIILLVVIMNKEPGKTGANRNNP